MSTAIATSRARVHAPQVCYGFEVTGSDGMRYEVIVQDDGLAFRRPIGTEQADCVIPAR